MNMDFWTERIAAFKRRQAQPRAPKKPAIIRLHIMKTLHESFMKIEDENEEMKKANRNIKYDLKFLKGEMKRFQTETSDAKKEAKRLRKILKNPKLKEKELKKRDRAQDALDKAGKVRMKAEKLLEISKENGGDEAASASLKKLKDEWQRQKDAGLFDDLLAADTLTDVEIKMEANDENETP